MSTFLQLPESSPAASLMASLVHTCDMLAEHGHLLGPEFGAGLFDLNALAAHILMMQESTSTGPTRAALDAAARR